MGHCYCHEHSLAFTNDRAFRNHERAEPHVTGFECLDCGRHYTTQRGLDDHLKSCQAKDPDRLASSGPSNTAAAAFAAFEEENLRCESCNRTFKSLAAQRQHKSSVKHKPLSEIRCFLSADCTQTFTSPSAYIFHLEGGKCKSGMTRHRLNCLVHAGDSSNRITFQENTRRLAPAGEADAASMFSALAGLSISSTSGVVLTPSLSSAGTRASGVVQDVDDGTEYGDEESVTTSTASLQGLRSPASTGTSTIGAETSRLSGSTSHAGDTSSSTTERGQDAMLPADDNDDFSTVISDSTGGAILTPSNTTTKSIGGIMLTPTSSVAGEWSFVPGYPAGAEALQYDAAKKAWACHLCNSTFKGKLVGEKKLLQHLDSPAHEAKLFHCGGIAAAATGPGTNKKHVKKFKTMSGLAQHIEAGSCAGGKDVLETVVGLFEKEIRIATGQRVKLLRSGSS